MARVLYKPIGLFVSVLGGLVAGAIFKRIWRVAADESKAPKATDERRSWREVTAARSGSGLRRRQGSHRPCGRDRLCSSYGLVAGAEQDVANVSHPNRYAKRPLVPGHYSARTVEPVFAAHGSRTHTSVCRFICCGMSSATTRHDSNTRSR